MDANYRVICEHRGNKVASSMALRRFLRSALEEYFGASIAGFSLRHRLIIDRLAVSHRLDQHMTSGNTIPNDLMCNGIGSGLRLGEDGHQVFLDRHVCCAARRMTDDFDVAVTAPLAKRCDHISDLRSRRCSYCSPITWKEYDGLRSTSDGIGVHAWRRSIQDAKIGNDRAGH